MSSEKIGLSSNWSIRSLLKFKIQTLSGQLSWSHYLEILKADNELEISFYTKQCEIKKWNVHKLKRQIKSGLFQRLALNRNKEEILTLSRQGQEIQNPQDIVKALLY